MRELFKPTAVQKKALELLSSSAKLDSFITGADKENAKPVQGELAITFADSFKDL